MSLDSVLQHILFLRNDTTTFLSHASHNSWKYVSIVDGNEVGWEAARGEWRRNIKFPKSVFLTAPPSSFRVFLTFPLGINMKCYFLLRQWYHVITQKRQRFIYMMLFCFLLKSAGVGESIRKKSQLYYAIKRLQRDGATAAERIDLTTNGMLCRNFIFVLKNGCNWHRGVNQTRFILNLDYCERIIKTPVGWRCQNVL